MRLIFIIILIAIIVVVITPKDIIYDFLRRVGEYMLNFLRKIDNLLRRFFLYVYRSFISFFEGIKNLLFRKAEEKIEEERRNLWERIKGKFLFLEFHSLSCLTLRRERI